MTAGRTLRRVGRARARGLPVVASAATVALVAALAVFLAGFGLPASAAGQSLATDDTVLRAIRDEAVNRSRLEPLARALLDSIGPRLTGSPGMERAQHWALAQLESWGVDARLEQYGTWEGWERGTSHVDLVAPRVRSLEGGLLAWSPGTRGRPVEAEVTYLTAAGATADWRVFLGTVRDRWVMVSVPQPTCRPDQQWLEYGLDGSVRRIADERQALAREWAAFLAFASVDGGLPAVHAALEEAGAAGIITSDWPRATGTTRVMEAFNRRTPTVELSCEDYGLLYRLAADGRRPRVRLASTAEALGEVPVYNVLGRVRGTELPDEYVVLSAHLDSWDGGSGATDNGAGVLQMMEALRVLLEAYPRPRRTLLLTLWSGEEQGLQGSGAFAEDHPEVLRGIQALFNQDSGTGRVVLVSAQGFPEAGAALLEWLEDVPSEVTEYLETEVPGTPGRGSDYASFVCRGVPSFPMGALSWDYGSHTWHTDRDTYDKLVFDDLRSNVVLTASLAYRASEHPEQVSRARRAPEAGPGDAGGERPSCRPVLRSSPSASGADP